MDGNPRPSGNGVDIGAYEYTDTIVGDVNGDGEVTAADASLVLKHIVGTRTLSPAEQDVADVTNNGTISALDAAWILQCSVGIREL